MFSDEFKLFINKLGFTIHQSRNQKKICYLKAPEDVCIARIFPMNFGKINKRLDENKWVMVQKIYTGCWLYKKVEGVEQYDDE